MTEPIPILELHDVHYRWPGRTPYELTEPVFELAPAETVLLLGKSRSGKSMLLSLICGTILAQSGSVKVAGTQIAPLSAGERDRFRAEQIGLIFQQFNLLPFASVRNHILLPLRFAPERVKRVPSLTKEAERLCRDIVLPNDIMGIRAGKLSVGQQQRVAAARALIGEPPPIVANEPTSSLDAATRATFLELLFAQSPAHKTTLMMISHDARLADQVDCVIQMTSIAQTKRRATCFFVWPLDRFLRDR